jgi:hypothetical protein
VVSFLRFLHQNHVCTSPISLTCYLPCPSHFSWLDHLYNFGEEYRLLSFSLCSFLYYPVMWMDIFIYLFNYPLSLDCLVLNVQMTVNNEFERMWKEVA